MKNIFLKGREMQLKKEIKNKQLQIKSRDGLIHYFEIVNLK